MPDSCLRGAAISPLTVRRQTWRQERRPIRNPKQGSGAGPWRCSGVRTDREPQVMRSLSATESR